MKKVFPALCILLLSGAQLLGQGAVNFANAGVGVNARAMLVDLFWALPAPTTNYLSGTNYLAQLWVGPLGCREQDLNPAGSPVPFHSGAKAGYFTGGSRVVPFIGSFTAQVRVWDAGLGSTWEAAQFANVWALRGRTAPFTAEAAYPPYLPPNLTNLTQMLFIAECMDAPNVRIFQQPASQTVARGDFVDIAVSATWCPNFPEAQWFFNGQPIPGANDLYRLIFPEVREEHAGDYFVVFANEGGRHTSAVARLTVLSPPALRSLPQSQTAEVGNPVRFEVKSVGKPPLAYQWRFNNSDLPGATSTSLKLEQVDFAHAGSYSVRVTNADGLTNSEPAVLAVIAPVPRTLVPGILMHGSPGNVVYLDASPNPGNTSTWSTIASTNLTTFTAWRFDLPMVSQRFYRTWSTVPTPPSVSIHYVPEIKLTGKIGTGVLVEGINQFGPTDAWFPVAIVALINTTQIYRDTSAVGQPPRLWRIRTGP